MEETAILEKDIILAVEQKLGTSDFNMLSCALNPVDEKIGMLGDHAYLNVIVINNSRNITQNLNYFVKLFPKSEALAVFASGAGAFPREEFSYTMFADFKRKGIDIIDRCIARCFVFKPNEYIIFDNLAEEGYKMPDKMEYLDYDSLLVVLRSLAQLHASSLIFEEKMSEEKEEIYRIINGNEKKLEETLYRDSEDFTNKDTIDAGFNCILKEIELFQFPDVLASGRKFLESAEELCPKIYELVKPSEKYRNVLCHGDLWATNILLKSDKTGKVDSCKIVDFQSVRYIPPAHDVLSVIYLTTCREFRRKHMYEVIGIYYNYLENFVKSAGYRVSEILPFSEFMSSCEEQNLFAVIFSAGILPLILSNRDYVEHVFCDKELYQKVFREDRIALVYNNENNEKYMNRLKESIQDLQDACTKLS